MDELDRKLLQLLVADARLSWAELAKQLELSAPAVAERARKLEAEGVIRGYAAQLDPEAAGRSVAALIAVTLDKPSARARFLRWVRDEDDVLACHHVAGDEDYVLTVRCPSMAALESLLSDGIKGIDGVARTRTTVVLSTLKEAPLGPARGKR